MRSAEQSSERTVPYQDVARDLSTARVGSGRDKRTISLTGLLSMQPMECFREEILYLFNFSNLSNADILITAFT